MSEKKALHIDISQVHLVPAILEAFEQQRNPRKLPEETEFIYCLVGNIVPCYYKGEEKKVTRGTKHFAPNAKLYVLPRIGNYKGERVRAIGFSRKNRRFTLVRMPVRLITNWRLKKVYKKEIIQIMFDNRGWRDTEIDRNTILNMIPWLSALTEKNLPSDCDENQP